MISPEHSAALLASGLLVPAPPAAAQVGKEKFDSVETIRASWAAGEADRWPETAVPEEPLCLAEVWALVNAVSFALRRATDGYMASRPIAVDALRLFNRIVTGAATAREVYALQPEGELGLAVLDLAYLTFHLARPLLLYLAGHRAPDIEQMEPDAWVTADETSAIRLRIFAAFIEAHELLETNLTSPSTTGPAPKVLKGRAELAAHRVMALSNVATVELGSVRPPADFPGMLDHDGLQSFVSLLSDYLKNPDPADPSSTAVCVMALGIVQHLWNGEDTEFAEVMTALSGDSLPLNDRAMALVGAMALNVESQSTVKIMATLLELIDAQPPEVQVQLRAHTTQPCCSALARIAHDDPEMASRLAGLLSGFDSDRSRWNSAHTHVWLIPGSPSIGLIDQSAGIEVIRLPGLLESPALAELVDHHAEEYDMTWPVQEVRKSLTAYLRPLSRRLAELGERATYYSFGHLQHLPLPALTSKDAILAVRPCLYRLARRRPLTGPAENKRDDRVIVVDQDLSQFKGVPTGPFQVWKFDSSAPDNDGVPEAFEQLRLGAHQIVFFGHGYVDQFQVEKIGLVTRREADRPVFVPSSVFADADLGSTELAVILSCGAGQGNVFVEPCLSVADAFTLAGAEFVISPIWPIDAGHAAEFLTRFMNRIAEGEAIVSAWSAILAEDPNRFCSIMLFAD
jgi:hypothetical protein